MECQRYAGVAGLIWFICHQVVVRYRLFTIKENDTGKMMVHEKVTKFQLILLMACILVGSGCRKQVTATTYEVSKGSPAWQFSRDENINSKHIIWTISSSYFSQGKYTESLDYANRLNVIDSTFDVTVVEGIQKLATEIARLRAPP